jgi:hypothetical protein
MILLVRSYKERMRFTTLYPTVHPSPGPPGCRDAGGIAEEKNVAILARLPKVRSLDHPSQCCLGRSESKQRPE